MREPRPGPGEGSEDVEGLGAVGGPRLPPLLLPLVLQQQRAAAAGPAVPGARSPGPGLGSLERPRAAAGPCESAEARPVPSQGPGIRGSGVRGRRRRCCSSPCGCSSKGQQQQQQRGPLPSLALSSSSAWPRLSCTTQSSCWAVREPKPGRGEGHGIRIQTAQGNRWPGCCSCCCCSSMGSSRASSSQRQLGLSAWRSPWVHVNHSYARLGRTYSLTLLVVLGVVAPAVVAADADVAIVAALGGGSMQKEEEGEAPYRHAQSEGGADRREVAGLLLVPAQLGPANGLLARTWSDVLAPRAICRKVSQHSLWRKRRSRRWIRVPSTPRNGEQTIWASLDRLSGCEHLRHPAASKRGRHFPSTLLKTICQLSASRQGGRRLCVLPLMPQLPLLPGFCVAGPLCFGPLARRARRVCCCSGVPRLGRSHHIKFDSRGGSGGGQQSRALARSALASALWHDPEQLLGRARALRPGRCRPRVQGSGPRGSTGAAAAAAAPPVAAAAEGSSSSSGDPCSPWRSRAALPGLGSPARRRAAAGLCARVKASRGWAEVEAEAEEEARPLTNSPRSGWHSDPPLRAGGTCRSAPHGRPAVPPPRKGTGPADLFLDFEPIQTRRWRGRRSRGGGGRSGKEGRGEGEKGEEVVEDVLGEVGDDGGGMSPDRMRCCVSLGYSEKSKAANTIGQCRCRPRVQGSGPRGSTGAAAAAASPPVAAAAEGSSSSSGDPCPPWRSRAALPGLGSPARRRAAAGSCARVKARSVWARAWGSGLRAHACSFNSAPLSEVDDTC
eukprot:jgi/Mesen1/3235/ME000187S02407